MNISRSKTHIGVSSYCTSNSRCDQLQVIIKKVIIKKVIAEKGTFEVNVCKVKLLLESDGALLQGAISFSLQGVIYSLSDI